jgi:hypothetical protein
MFSNVSISASRIFVRDMGRISKCIYDLSDRLSLWWNDLTGIDPKQKALEMKQDYATPKRINIAIDKALGIDKDDKDRD